MFESGHSAEQAVLVHLSFPQEDDREDLHELMMLVDSSGVERVAIVQGQRSTPDARFFVGSGKAVEIAQTVEAMKADVVIFNHALSPSQTRNLERLCHCKVIDRTSLILDIFAQRARSYEGKLQVELAQLRHLASRLIRGFDNERQKGGIGLRGPGETQLESDRRLLKARISALRERLDKVRQQRSTSRKARQRSEIPVISLVGYTNAGKSSLFNQLTDADVYAADQLFATLDPTLRRVRLIDFGPVIFADTVGFIRHLPHDLVAAFKSTLQETQDADLQLHVIDVADERVEDNQVQVQQVLAEIEADQVPQLKVFNKIDLTGHASRIEYDENMQPMAVWISAHSGEGLELLRTAIRERLASGYFSCQLALPAEQSVWRARFHQAGVVQAEQFDELGICRMHLAMSRALWDKWVKLSDMQLPLWLESPAAQQEFND